MDGSVVIPTIYISPSKSSYSFSADQMRKFSSFVSFVFFPNIIPASSVASKSQTSDILRNSPLD